MSKMTTITALAAAAALSACSLMPAYEAPLVNIPQRFAYDAPQEQAGVPVAAVGWQDWFADPRLHRLIEMALSCNTDLRQAALNAEAVQKQYAITRAELFPSLDASASGTRARVARDLSPTG
ncbi:MAG: TolC family protein, partial [Ottowia sp.]|nr:TolC family protein [Ottowia sp.]